METLEIKHLAPYLPYNLKIQGHTHGQIEILSCVTESSVNIKGRGFTYGMWADIFDIKPILRPLSDLSSLGNKDISINEHTINILIHEKHGLEYGVFSYYKNMLDIELDGDHMVQYDQNKSISLYVVLDIYNELLKGHYDVFGLIEKGLAIDINTL